MQARQQPMQQPQPQSAGPLPAYQQQLQAQQFSNQQQQQASQQYAYQQQAYQQHAYQQAQAQARMQAQARVQAQQQAQLQAQQHRLQQVQAAQQAEAQRLQAQQAQIASAQRALENAAASGYGSQASNYPVGRQDTPVVVQSAPKSHGWIVALVFVLCLFALGAFGLYSCSGRPNIFGTAPVMADNTVALINMDGAIQYDGSACSPEGLGSLLDYAESTDAIKAVVLRVNSGGGTATAGEEMAALVNNFSKPIVVSSASLNASAAYEVSSQADYIYVAQTTEIGSIGTYMQVADYSGLMRMLGINVDTIASSDSKGSTSGYRALTQEEREYYQHMVDQINEVFIQNVAAGRGMPVDAVRRLATGMVYTGIDAVENGLADSFGGREDALQKAAELAGMDTYSTYELGFTSSNFNVLEYLLSSEEASQIALDKLTERFGTPPSV